MTNEAGGPYVQAAAICERVLQEKDGVLSLIRLVDRFTVTAAGPAPPEAMPPTNISANFVVMLKSGFIRARHTLKIVPTTPSGKNLPEISAGVLFEGDDRGVNTNFQANILAQEEGLYWFDVFLEDQLLTRIPLRLVYQRVSQGPLFQTP
jgi:hypothetical protein